MKKPQGFAAMSLERRTAIAAMGGKKAHANCKAHKFTSEEARLAGKKGGMTTSANREHMAIIGSRGGSRKKTDKDIS